MIKFILCSLLKLFFWAYWHVSIDVRLLFRLNSNLSRWWKRRCPYWFSFSYLCRFSNFDSLIKAYPIFLFASHFSILLINGASPWNLASMWSASIGSFSLILFLRGNLWRIYGTNLTTFWSCLNFFILEALLRYLLIRIIN